MYAYGILSVIVIAIFMAGWWLRGWSDKRAARKDPRRVVGRIMDVDVRDDGVYATGVIQDDEMMAKISRGSVEGLSIGPYVPIYDETGVKIQGSNLSAAAVYRQTKNLLGRGKGNV